MSFFGRKIVPPWLTSFPACPNIFGCQTDDARIIGQFTMLRGDVEFDNKAHVDYHIISKENFKNIIDKN